MLMLLRSVRNALEAFMASLERRVVARPFSDLRGEKGWWAWLSRAPAHRVSPIHIQVRGWPRLTCPLRLFLSDLHIGSHADDVERFDRIMHAAAELQPDLMCLGGDYINGMLFGRGRVPPETIAGILATAKPLLGTFAVLGDHCPS